MTPTTHPSITPPATRAHVEWARGLAAGTQAPPPVAVLVGFDAVHADLGVAVMELSAEARHANPMGTLHGGIVVDVADAAMGIALSTTLEDGESFTTVDLTANYFKPIRQARIRATAVVTRRTRSLGFVECEVTDEGGSVVAKVFSTCMVLRGDDAKGR